MIFGCGLPCKNVSCGDASPDAFLQDDEKPEQRRWSFHPFHHDGGPDEVVIRHRVVDDGLAFGHHGQSPQHNVSTLKERSQYYIMMIVGLIFEHSAKYVTSLMSSSWESAWESGSEGVINYLS